MPLEIPSGPLRLGGKGGLRIKGGSFNPTSYGTVVGWYKADAITPVADGTAIASWGDSSSAGNALTQATGSLQPLYKTAIQNGLPAVRFDGTDDQLAKSFTLNQTATYFIVCKWLNAFAATTVAVGGQGSTNGALYRKTATTVAAFAGTEAVSGATTPGAFHTYVCSYAGASSILGVDGSESTVNVGVGNLAGLSLGKAGNGTQAANVDICEVIAYSGNPSNHAAIQAYLKAKWATP